MRWGSEDDVDGLGPPEAGTMVRLRVPPNPNFARFVREKIVGFTALHGVPEDDRGAFVTAIGEALANAVEHARTTDTIEVSCWIVGDEQLIATVVDTGVGFAAERAGDAFPSELAERGRGIGIMRHCADIFSLRSTPGKGTSVVLGRYIRGRARPQVPTETASDSLTG